MTLSADSIADLKEVAEYLSSTQESASLIETCEVVRDELVVVARRDSILELLRFLRDDAQCRFESLMDICGVDYPARKERFEVVYHLLSMRLGQRIRIKLSTDEETPVPSVVELFPCCKLVRARSFRHVWSVVFKSP